MKPHSRVVLYFNIHLSLSQPLPCIQLPCPLSPDLTLQPSSRKITPSPPCWSPLSVTFLVSVSGVTALATWGTSRSPPATTPGKGRHWPQRRRQRVTDPTAEGWSWTQAGPWKKMAGNKKCQQMRLCLVWWTFHWIYVFLIIWGFRGIFLWLIGVKF